LPWPINSLFCERSIAVQSRDANGGTDALAEDQVALDTTLNTTPADPAPDSAPAGIASAELLREAIGQRLSGVSDLLNLFQAFGSGANFASLGKIFDLIQRLGGLDKVLPAVRNILTALQALSQVTEPIDTVAGLRQRLTFLLQAADAVSDLTPNAYDNQVIEFAQQAVANDAVLTLIVMVLQKRRQAGGSAGGGGAAGRGAAGSGAGGSGAGGAQSPFDFVRAAREALNEL
jgi:hypothetical protein